MTGILLLSQSYYVSGWSSGFVLMSSPSNTPTLDGVLSDDWRGPNVNSSYHNLPSNIPINFYVLHNGSSIYFAVHVRFDTTVNNESLILYISKNSSLSSDDLFDRKAVLITNASGTENASVVEKKDFYRNPDTEAAEQWLTDTETIKWNVSVGKDERNYRVYEFQIPLSSEKEDENIKMVVGNQYTIVVSFAQNHNFDDEKKAEPLILQVGPKGLAGNEDIGEFKIDKEKFIQWSEIIVAIIFAMFGVLLLTTKSKVGDLSIREFEEDTTEALDQKAKEQKQKNIVVDKQVAKTGKKGGK